MMKQFSTLREKIEQIKRDLDNRSDFQDEPQGRCPDCDGYGNIIDEKGARLCHCVKSDIIQSEISLAHIPKKFSDVTLDSFKITKPILKGVHQKACNYVENYSLENYKGMYIYGPTGTGKSHLSIGILKGLIQKGFDGVFYNIVDLLDAIRKTYNPDSQLSDKNLLEMEMNRQIFVLDDFGVQKTSSWVSDRLYALINRRYQDCKTIIITSNIPLMDLQMKVDNRLASRIVEMCMEIEIQVSDYRKGLYEKYQKSPSAFQMQHKRT
jgi:DNA replication protein DnaC